MPVVNGKEFPYTKKGMAAAKRAEDTKPSGMGMMNKTTPGTMTNPQKTKKQGSNVEAMKSALKRAASAAKKTNLPAKAGDSGMKSNMPAVKGMPAKKKNLGM
jgi:hypothetical protein